LQGVILSAVKIAVGAAFLVTLFVTFWTGAPVAETAFFEENTPSKMEDIRSSSAYLGRKLDANKRVLVVRANYYAASTTVKPATTARVHGIAYNAKNISGTAYYNRTGKSLRRGLESGRIAYVIGTPRTAYVVRRWRGARRAFRDHYCRVKSPYSAKYNVSLFKWHPQARDDCVNKIKKRWPP
jgi:hypothetical protein